MAEVIYVRGGKGCGSSDTSAFTPQEYVWNYSHPRAPRTNTRLTLFDYVEGSYKQWNHWDGQHPPMKKGTPLKPDGEVRILSGEDNCGSIVALYNYIKAIGSKAPGSLIELQFFTHGWHEGPIIVDTDEEPIYATDGTKRDPKDKDTRLKDFDIPDVLGREGGAIFKKAFFRSALVKLWGCTYEQEHRQKVKSFVRTKDPKEKQSILAAYLRYIRESTFQFRMAKLLDMPVYAAPLGWGTDPHIPFGVYGESAYKTNAKYRGIFPPAKGDEWWQVSPFFRPDGGFQFYQQVLGAQLDILGYVAYTASIGVKS